MELGIVRQRYTPYGGAERFVTDALAALARREVALTLYTRAWPGPAPGGAAFTPVICDPFHVGNVWRDWSFARCVRASWARHRPDLVQSHERIAGCDVFRAGDGVHRVWLAERARGLPAWRRFLLCLNPYHHYVLHAESRMFGDPRLRAVICNSHLVREQIKRHFGVDEARLHVIYNAVDCDRFAPPSPAMRLAARAHFGLPSDATVFVLVGSGYQRKGVAQAIAALASLSDSAWLVVAGKDRQLERYRAHAARLGVAARVQLRGPVDDVAPLLHAADVFVLPTIYDPLPNAALEAMATGLPVITSTQCGAAELLVAHDAGIACDARDVEGLSNAMRQLSDPGRRQSMGARARRAVEPLAAAAMSKHLLDLYESLLASPAAPSPGARSRNEARP